VVFEAKDRRLSKPRALEELDKAMSDRDADFAVLVVPSDEEVPAKLQTLREYNGDKLVVTLDPDEGTTLALELGYRLARARVLMARGSAEGIDAAAVRDAVQRALHSMDEVRRIKSTLTGAVSSIEKGKELVDAMAGRVRAQLDEVDALARTEAGDAPASPPPQDEDDQPELDLD
jgi:flavin-binding protein dodecin